MKKGAKRNLILPLFAENSSKLTDMCVTQSAYSNEKHGILLDSAPIMHTCDFEGKIRSFLTYDTQNLEEESSWNVRCIKTTNVTNKPLHSLDCLTMDNQHHYLASTSKALYQILNGNVIYKANHAQEISKVSYMNAGTSNIFVTGHKNGHVAVHDSRTGKSVSSMKSSKIQSAEITNMKIWQNSENDIQNMLIITSNSNGCISIFENRMNLNIIDISDSAEDDINCFDISGSKLFLGLAQGEIGVLNLKKLGPLENRYNTHPQGITSIHCLDNRDYDSVQLNDKVLTGCEDGVIRLINSSNMRIENSIKDSKDIKFDNSVFTDVTHLNLIEAKSKLGFSQPMICFISNISYVKVYNMIDFSDFFNSTNTEEDSERKESEEDKISNESGSEDISQNEDSNKSKDSNEIEEDVNEERDQDEESESISDIDESDSEDRIKREKNLKNKPIKSKEMKIQEKLLNSSFAHGKEKRRQFFQEL